MALISGGIDSSAMVWLLKKEDCKIYPLFVDYGQLAARLEWGACKKICKLLDLKPNRIDLRGFGKFIKSGITNKFDIRRNNFLPGRNLLLLTVGAAFGYQKAAHIVAVGLLANPIYPDATSKFLEASKTAITRSLGIEISILAPLISLSKSDVIALAHEEGLPLHLTYSCFSGTKKPCEICSSCKERISAEQTLVKK